MKNEASFKETWEQEAVKKSILCFAVCRSRFCHGVFLRGGYELLGSTTPGLL
jgi:hypothetical protein